MCTHLTETKSEKKSLNAKRNGKNFDVLQTSSFKRVGSTGSFDDYGESFWCLYTTKTMKILFLFRLPDFFLPVSMGLSIYWKSVWSHHQKLQRVVVQVTISLRFLDQTKLQTWEPVSMDDNGMLFTVFQNRMHLAIIVFWEKKSWEPGPSSLVVIFMSYKNQGVKETILKRMVLLASLKRKVLHFSDLSNLEAMIYNWTSTWGEWNTFLCSRW